MVVNRAHIWSTAVMPSTARSTTISGLSLAIAMMTKAMAAEMPHAISTHFNMSGLSRASLTLMLPITRLDRTLARRCILAANRRVDREMFGFRVLALCGDLPRDGRFRRDVPGAVGSGLEGLGEFSIFFMFSFQGAGLTFGTGVAGCEGGSGGADRTSSHRSPLKAAVH